MDSYSQIVLGVHFINPLNRNRQQDFEPALDNTHFLLALISPPFDSQFALGGNVKEQLEIVERLPLFT